MSFGMDLGYVARLIDLPTICLLLLFLIPLLLSGGLLKDFNNAFRLGMGKKAPESLMELKRAKESVSLTIKIMFCLSVFVCAVQGIGVIYNMSDPWLLGPYFSMSLLALVYGIGIALILLPLQARLNIKIQEFISEKE